MCKAHQLSDKNQGKQCLMSSDKHSPRTMQDVPLVPHTLVRGKASTFDGKQSTFLTRPSSAHLYLSFERGGSPPTQACSKGTSGQRDMGSLAMAGSPQASQGRGGAAFGPSPVLNMRKDRSESSVGEGRASPVPHIGGALLKNGLENLAALLDKHSVHDLMHPSNSALDAVEVCKEVDREVSSLVHAALAAEADFREYSSYLEALLHQEQEELFEHVTARTQLEHEAEKLKLERDRADRKAKRLLLDGDEEISVLRLRLQAAEQKIGEMQLMLQEAQEASDEARGETLDLKLKLVHLHREIEFTRTKSTKNGRHSPEGHLLSSPPRSPRRHLESGNASPVARAINNLDELAARGSTRSPGERTSSRWSFGGSIVGAR